MLYFLLPRERSSHVTVGGNFGLWHLTLGFVLPHPGPYFNVLPFSWELPSQPHLCISYSLCLEYPFPFCPFIELSFISQNSSGIPSLWHAYRPHHLHCTSRTQRINRSLSTTSTLNTWECICISISKGTRWSQTQHERRLQTCSQP